MSNESYVTSNTHLLQSAFTGSAFNVFGISPNLFRFLESIVEFDSSLWPSDELGQK